MKKIPTIFERGQDGKITDEVNPECLWVFKGGAYSKDRRRMLHGSQWRTVQAA